MDKKEIFLLTLVVGVMIMLTYFLGLSMTGYVTFSTFCDESGCKEICKFNDDCIGDNEICCDGKGIGFCEHISECQKPFVLGGTDTDIKLRVDIKKPTIQTTELIKTDYTDFYFNLYLGALIILLIYGFAKRKRYLNNLNKGRSKKTTKKKTVKRSLKKNSKVKKKKKLKRKAVKR